MEKFYRKPWSLLLSILLLANFSTHAQWNCTIDLEETGNGAAADNDVVTITKWTPRTSLNFGNGKFKALMEYLPAGYNDAGNTEKYPLLLYFGGVGASTGAGTLAGLCKFFSDQETSLPWQVEKGTIVPTATNNGTSYNYLVIAPQYSDYNYPTNWPNADDVSAVIDYIVANYRVDPARIYLTGMSAGANMVVHYASSSLARARSIAAFNTSSLCAPYDFLPGTAENYKNIANANLPGRFVHCTNDNLCDVSISQQWSSLINSEKAGLTTFSAASFGCNYSGHNSWAYNYNPATEIGGLNLYDWFIQFTANIALPVKIKSFTGTLSKDKVILDWVTSSETSSASFRIERAGSDYRFTPLSSIPAAGSSTTDKAYQFIDPNPLPNLNLYRLVQVDADGAERMSEIIKVMNKNSGKFHLSISPNPFTTKLTAYLNLEKRQKVNATLTDLNGRKISSQSMILNEGSSEIIIPTTTLQKGIYLLRIETEQSTQIQKVIRQ